MEEKPTINYDDFLWFLHIKSVLTCNMLFYNSNKHEYENWGTALAWLLKHPRRERAEINSSIIQL